MKKIRLFGDLEQFRAEWELDVKTVSEALRAIEANRPGFIAAADKGEYVLILAHPENPDLCRQVTITNALDAWDCEVLLVIPRIGGDIPAALIWAYAMMAFTYIGIGAGVAAVLAEAVVLLVTIAASMAVSMVVSLISGTNEGAKAQETERYDSKPSYLFNGVVNTTRQGHRIPLLYGGPMLVGSMTLSSQIHTKDIPV